MSRHRFAMLVGLVLCGTVAVAPGDAGAQIGCGAIIKTSVTLSPSDPVTSATCPNGGLVLAAQDIAVDCAGLTLRGSGVGVGIKVGVGAGNLELLNCVVQGFNKGVALGGVGGVFMQNVVAQNNTGVGVVVESDFNFLFAVVSRGNAGHGVQFGGTGNAGDSMTALQNGKAGFSFSGRAFEVSGSQAIANAQQGFTGIVRESFFFGNLAISNGGDGMSLSGGTLLLPNGYGDNRAIANAGSGISIAGTSQDINSDGGGNIGLANTGAVQCRIAGQACQ